MSPPGLPRFYSSALREPRRAWLFGRNEAGVFPPFSPFPKEWSGRRDPANRVGDLDAAFDFQSRVKCGERKIRSCPKPEWDCPSLRCLLSFLSSRLGKTAFLSLSFSLLFLLFSSSFSSHFSFFPSPQSFLSFLFLFFSLSLFPSPLSLPFSFLSLSFLPTYPLPLPLPLLHFPSFPSSSPSFLSQPNKYTSLCKVWKPRQAF